jgi:hypothetical protein
VNDFIFQRQVLHQINNPLTVALLNLEFAESGEKSPQVLVARQAIEEVRLWLWAWKRFSARVTDKTWFDVGQEIRGNLFLVDKYKILKDISAKFVTTENVSVTLYANPFIFQQILLSILKNFGYQEIEVSLSPSLEKLIITLEGRFPIHQVHEAPTASYQPNFFSFSQFFTMTEIKKNLVDHFQTDFLQEENRIQISLLQT